MPNLEQQILDTLKANPGQKAKDLATTLDVDRKILNTLLYGKLKGQVIQDKNYNWYLKSSFQSVAFKEEPKRLNTPIAKLCRYYLDCLTHDDLGGVSEFASSKYDDPNYIELSAFPMFDEQAPDPLDSEAGKRLLNRMRRDRNRKTLFLGYPVRLNWIRSKKGWEGFLVEPVLLFPFDEPGSKYERPQLSNDLPQFNFKALKALSNTGDSSLMEEAILLATELGMDSTGDDQPDIDELLARLYEIRSDWDWQEQLDPYKLTCDPSISQLDQQGIYNRAILVTVERSPYTRGLETELGVLQTVEDELVIGTALGSWLTGENIESPPTDQLPLIEVLPLNSEQRQAVQQSLINPLTVITGPPGTGKSQVVTSILINATWQGKKVLFASKNNKAVDVVETRVNSLGTRPILLRLGANQYQSTLAQYLVTLLASSATDIDQQRYKDYESVHRQLLNKSEELDEQFISLVELRNEVDQLEQIVESIREEVGETLFKSFRIIDMDIIKNGIDILQNVITKANRNAQPFFIRILWYFIREKRVSNLTEAGSSFAHISEQIGLRLPELVPEATFVKEWIDYGERIKSRVQQLLSVQEYFVKLNTLTNTSSLEELNQQRRSLIENFTENSISVWQTWLRLQPARLSKEQRKLLGDYSALLQMIVSADDENKKIGGEAFKRYYQLLPKITSMLSCWAVTSLSARGRIPLDPNFFDLLVIDEASQCDIASALPLLYRTKQVVIIGDPMQLKHISTLSKHQDLQLLSKHDLVNDYPGWAYSNRSLFDLGSSICNSEDIVSLRDHHRSHEDIIKFSNETFYEGRLRVATNYNRLKLTSRDKPVVRWIDVKGQAARPGTGGAVNEKEAEAVVEEIKRLVSQGYRGSIGVVSPFRAQANRIRDLVYSSNSLSSQVSNADFLADTVHKFQGDERDVMIFSPVVSSGISDGSLGFLRSNPNLFNVAITRARASLIVVGNKSAALNCDVDYLAKFAAYTDQVKIVRPIVEEDDFGDLGPAYPRVSNPELVSTWEHVFYSALYEAGIRSIPQYQVEKYILDYAIIQDDKRLNIEIDGERYHRNWDGELCRRDQIRNQRLIELGWDVMRFWVYQVRDDMDFCINKVKKWMRNE